MEGTHWGWCSIAFKKLFSWFFWLVYIYWKLQIQINNRNLRPYMTSMKVCPSNVPLGGNLPGWEQLADTSSCWTYGICHHMYTGAMISRMLSANDWAQWGYQSWGISPLNGAAALWVVCAPQLLISLTEMFLEQQCNLRLFLPNFPSSLFSNKCQTHITVWRRSPWLVLILLSLTHHRHFPNTSYKILIDLVFACQRTPAIHLPPVSSATGLQ